jgi:hypothetical protein
MAAITPTVSIVGDSTPQCVAITWTPVSSGSSDTCVAAFVGHLQDKTVHIFGDTVTSVAITGSLEDGGAGTYFTMNDPQGNALSAINAAKGEALLEHVGYIQPTVTTGTNVTIIVFGRQSFT